MGVPAKTAKLAIPSKLLVTDVGINESAEYELQMTCLEIHAMGSSSTWKSDIFA